jgi:hypothetical protein
MAVFNVANLVLFVGPAYYSTGAAVAWIWKAQLTMQIPITLISLYLVWGENVSSVKPFTFNFAMPAVCGMNPESFVFFNIFWFLPFLLGFLIDPNGFFGPTGPMPMPMFLGEMNETAVWFGRAWAVGCFIVVMGSAIFSHPAIKVCKQLLVFYITSTAIFIPAVTTGSFFNPTVMIPMTGLNVVFLIACIFIIKKDSDETGKGLLSIV